MKKPDAAVPTPAEPTLAFQHFTNVDALLARYEAEFAKAVGNIHAPADSIGDLLTAIHGLRIERERMAEVIAAQRRMMLRPMPDVGRTARAAISI